MVTVLLYSELQWSQVREDVSRVTPSHVTRDTHGQSSPMVTGVHTQNRNGHRSAYWEVTRDMKLHGRTNTVFGIKVYRQTSDTDHSTVLF